MKNKPIIGLTGGVGCGKSIVARQFQELGCAVIDADALNHQMLARSEVVQQILSWWGRELLGSDGRIDRKALGRIVFDDANKLRKLTNLVHPLIIKREKELLQAHQADANVAAVVLDMPLLFELGQDKWCDAVVFVEADESSRVERLRRDRGWEAEKLAKIEKLQLPLNKKAEKADYIIGNSSNIPDLAAQVAKVFSQIV